MRIRLQLLFAVLITTFVLTGCSDHESDPQGSADADQVKDEPSQKTSSLDDDQAMSGEAAESTEDGAEENAMSGMKRTSAPKDASAAIIAPKDGATVTTPVMVKFGLDGMEGAPAGTDKPNTGHHHLLVDMEQMPAMNKPLPSTDQLLHFGKGQTETKLELEPGQHTLQLLLGDHRHVPHQPAVTSETITITVEK